MSLHVFTQMSLKNLALNVTWRQGAHTTSCVPGGTLNVVPRLGRLGREDTTEFNFLQKKKGRDFEGD